MAHIDTHDWDQIDTIFLDMDGTLLDLHFDNYFWMEHVPERYAEARGIPLEQARKALAEQYRAIEGTLNWYCLDYWSEALGLDIAMLKEEVDHLIQVHPHVIDFLARARRVGKRLVLLTNAHRKSLRLKMEKTRLAGYFDAIISAHDIGLPKEDVRFWDRLGAVEPFDRQRTLFADDSLSVLRSAKRAKFRWLLVILKPDSRLPVREKDEFQAVKDFSEVIVFMPDDSSTY